MHIQKQIKLVLVALRVFIDVFSEEEIISDSYQFEYSHNNAVIGVQSTFIRIGNQSESNEDLMPEEVPFNNSARALNILQQFQYNQIALTKKEFNSYIKKYIQKVKEYLEQNNPSRVEGFLSGAKSMTYYVIEKFQDITFYTPKSGSMENMLIMAYYENNSETPIFFYFIDGLKVLGQ